MNHSPPKHAGGNVIPLNARLIDRCDRREIEKAIREIVRNVRFEFLEQECAIRLLGPDMYYHAFDPYLPAALKRFDSRIDVDDILSYRSQGDLFDLCFEDSWSGYLIADELSRTRHKDHLVIIHLDDHTDMMSTLLEFSHEGALVDPTTGKPFDPKSPASWEASIYSGSVSIGCFVTPFYFGDWRTHVRHLNNAAGEPTRSCGVIKRPSGYGLIPRKRFAAVQLGHANEATNAGSYVVSSDCEEILDTLPCGRVIVHVDLDYLINDFNGNPGDRTYIPTPAVIEKGRRKLNHFFDALHARPVNVERWIIATSPGFCSACHWERLLNAFTEKIHVYNNRRRPTDSHRTGL
jgi:hypothetical protein